MHQFEIILALLVAVVLVGIAARRLGVPSPVLLVIGGLVIALLPGLPRVAFEPNLIFVVFIPPLLYRAALTASWRDLRANLRPISLLAVGLVVFTTIVVGVAAHTVVPGLPWAAAFALGALVSPPDAPAATAFLRQLVVPRRIATILEGESLVNDATAIVAYRMAVAAAVSGSFSVAAAGLRFVWVGTAGVAVGLGAAWLIAWLRRHIHAPEIEATISLLTPFAAFLPAEAVGVSGVLAVVACGLYLGRLGPRIVAPDTRVQTEGMWGVVAFVLEGLTFVFVGLELRAVLGTLGAYSVGDLAIAGLAVSVVTIAARVVWVFTASYGPRWLSRRARQHDPPPSWRHVALIAWAGLRGADSLVLALALPFTTAAGAPFPGRDIIIFLTYTVILVTLAQGFSLQPLVSWLGICDTGETQRLEEAHAREQASAAALRRLEQLAGELDGETLTELRARYGHRRRRFGARVRAERDGTEERLARGRRDAVLELLQAERRAVIALRDKGMIGDHVMRRVQRDLDLEALLLGSR
ncbi:MAG: Na+/H+ antiporter [Gemmatimonadetes bacterium 13_1_40CM_4_69_8]|nr:MAG: Na+/H+ antiporter [Gemmatimonadetes bacterium 13_1_40CM_4_69_8]